jgi:hypothetical protein
VKNNRIFCITLTWAAALVLSLILTLPALADGPAAVSWLKAQQNPDGGFGSPESTVGATADVLLAVAATGDNAIDWSQDGNTPYSYMQANAASIASIGDTAKVVLALIASGQNPRDLGGVDLIAQLENALGDDGQYGESGLINDQALAMIALSSAQRMVPAAANDYVLARQIDDGTWAWNGDTTEGTGDNNTAAMAVIALRAAGVPADHPQLVKTLQHFKKQQNKDGGFPYISPSPYGTDSDSNSTAVVIWAIKAAGQDPAGDEWKYDGQDGRSPVDKLRAFQNESGAYRWQDAMPDDNFMSTVQAVIAAQLKTLPFATMDVGQAAAEPAETPEPAALPETGANMWSATLPLIVSGLALTGVGIGLRKRR